MLAIEVNSWNLVTITGDFSGSPPHFDSDDILTITNPLNHASQTAVGQNHAVTSYSHWWIPDAGLASFHTQFDHHIETAWLRMNSTSDIRFTVAEDSTLSALGSLTYSHAPGDEQRVDFQFLLSDLTAGGVLDNQLQQGGAGLMLPSSGTLAVEGEYNLFAGHLYRLAFRSELFGTPFQPTGPFDADGFIQITITPEPATAILLSAAAPLALRRRRRCR